MLCPQNPPVADTSYYQIRTAKRLVSASLEREHVTGRRLELYHLVAGSWTGRLPSWGAERLHDNDFDLDCLIVASSANSTYCSVFAACGGIHEWYLDSRCTTKVTMFDNTGCATAPPPVQGRSVVLPGQKQEAMGYYRADTGPGTFQCEPKGMRTLYGLAPDLLPLDRFAQFTTVVDSE